MKSKVEGENLYRSVCVLHDQRNSGNGTAEVKWQAEKVAINDFVFLGRLIG